MIVLIDAARLHRSQFDLAHGQVTPTVAEQFDAIVLVEADELRHRSKHLQINRTYIYILSTRFLAVPITEDARSLDG